MRQQLGKLRARLAVFLELPDRPQQFRHPFDKSEALAFDHFPGTGFMFNSTSFGL